MLAWPAEGSRTAFILINGTYSWLCWPKRLIPRKQSLVFTPSQSISRSRYSLVILNTHMRNWSVWWRKTHSDFHCCLTDLELMRLFVQNPLSHWFKHNNINEWTNTFIFICITEKKKKDWFRFLVPSHRLELNIFR